MEDFTVGFVNMYNGVKGTIESLTFWGMANVLMWTVSCVLGAIMLYDMGKTDGRYDEADLTSSREGEIEAVSEKHKI